MINKRKYTGQLKRNHLPAVFIYLKSMKLHTRKWTILFIITLIPLGIYTKFYTGPASVWVNNSLGGVLYIIFWSLLLFLIRPQYSSVKIVSIVFSGTCFLEFLQLWHSEIFEIIRYNFIGRSIIGTTFSWLDFFYYFIGVILSYYTIIFLCQKERAKK
jgi:hypothetical protein